MCDLACCPALDSFDLAYVGIGMWATYREAYSSWGLTKVDMLSDVCLFVLFVYFYVCSPMSYWLWWSHFEHGGSISGQG